MHYKNFKTAVYLPAWIIERLDSDKLASDYEFMERYIGVDKVYIETHRDTKDIPIEKIQMAKEFLESKGVEVAGGITLTIYDIGDRDEKLDRRLFGTFCYTDPVFRDKVKEIVEFTAGIFDEIILDDYFFTNCSCEKCIKAKGDRDWPTFRRELMNDVSKNLIVDTAKKINPNVKMIVKYPNWRESFHYTGYLPDDQQDIFDGTYIGTETRSPKYTDQHLPEYLSYSLVRYTENSWPDRVGGGWFDTFQCWSTDRYMEQAYLTAFAKAKELMFFQWGDLVDNRFVGSMQIQLNKIDDILSQVGKPVGIPVYIPYASSGENHVEMRLGMQGIPIEPTPNFPDVSAKMLLTESSAADKDVVTKLEQFVRAGGDAFITTGFLAKKGEELRAAGLTEASVSGRKINVTRFHMTHYNEDYIEDRKPITFSEIVHGNNESWSLLNGGDGEYHFSLFLVSTYGMGRVYIVSIPDNPADIRNIPSEALDVLRRALRMPEFVSGHDFSAFTYDDDSMLLYRYVKDPVRPAKVKVFTTGEYDYLMDMVTGEKIESNSTWMYEEFELKRYQVAEVILEPGVFRLFRWKKEQE